MRTLAALTATTVAAGAFIAAPASANAACTPMVAQASATKSNIVIGPTRSASVTFRATTSDACAAISSLELGWHHNANYDYADLAHISGASPTETWGGSHTINPFYLFNSAAGTNTIDVSWIADADGNSSDSQPGVGHFYLKRAATATTAVSPSRPSAGGTVTITGHLSRANWDTNKYSNYGRQPAELQVRSRNGTTYVPVGTFTADSNGNYRTTVRASYDRYYRWHFAGDSTTGHSDATGKLVDVR